MLDLDAFGVMLRLARERRGMRPIDLAVSMRWSGTAPVYRYERGGPNAPRPDPDTVNLVAQILGLDYADRITLLGLAGHIPDTEPLTADEEQRIIDAARPSLEALSSPALLFDYRWRIRALNAIYRAALGLDPQDEAAWRERGVTTLDLTWDASLGLRDSLEDVDAISELQMLRFKLFNRLRRHEAWYREYPDCRAHLPGFVDLWEQTDHLLARPLADLDLGSIMHHPLVRRLPDGTRQAVDAEQRNLHGAYGLLGMLVMRVERDDGTE